jgi:hypothetical protein
MQTLNLCIDDDLSLLPIFLDIMGDCIDPSELIRQLPPRPDDAQMMNLRSLGVKLVLRRPNKHATQIQKTHKYRRGVMPPRDILKTQKSLSEWYITKGLVLFPRMLEIVVTVIDIESKLHYKFAWLIRRGRLVLGGLAAPDTTIACQDFGDQQKGPECRQRRTPTQGVHWRYYRLC